jgi:hypothetical protein
MHGLALSNAEPTYALQLLVGTVLSRLQSLESRLDEGTMAGDGPPVSELSLAATTAFAAAFACRIL